MTLLRSIGSECILAIWGQIRKNKRVLIKEHFTYSLPTQSSHSAFIVASLLLVQIWRQPKFTTLSHHQLTLPRCPLTLISGYTPLEVF